MVSSRARRFSTLQSTASAPSTLPYQDLSA
jgi:hypothetical protein